MLSFCTRCGNIFLECPPFVQTVEDLNKKSRDRRTSTFERYDAFFQVFLKSIALLSIIHKKDLKYALYLHIAGSVTGVASTEIRRRRTNGRIDREYLFEQGDRIASSITFNAVRIVDKLKNSKYLNLQSISQKIQPYTKDAHFYYQSLKKAVQELFEKISTFVNKFMIIFILPCECTADLYDISNPDSQQNDDAFDQAARHAKEREKAIRIFLTYENKIGQIKEIPEQLKRRFKYKCALKGTPIRFIVTPNVSNESASKEIEAKLKNAKYERKNLEEWIKEYNNQPNAKLSNWPKDLVPMPITMTSFKIDELAQAEIDTQIKQVMKEYKKLYGMTSFLSKINDMTDIIFLKLITKSMSFYH